MGPPDARRPPPQGGPSGTPGALEQARQARQALEGYKGGDVGKLAIRVSGAQGNH
jgi:hypothetical protein